MSIPDVKCAPISSPSVAMSQTLLEPTGTPAPIPFEDERYEASPSSNPRRTSGESRVSITITNLSPDPVVSPPQLSVQPAPRLPTSGDIVGGFSTRLPWHAKSRKRSSVISIRSSDKVHPAYTEDIFVPEHILPAAPVNQPWKPTTEELFLEGDSSADLEHYRKFLRSRRGGLSRAISIAQHDLEKPKQAHSRYIRKTSRPTTIAETRRAVQPVTSRKEAGLLRQGSIAKVYEKAKLRGVQLQRKPWAQWLFEYGIYTVLLAFVYFVLVGIPLWNGAVWWLYWVVEHKFVIQGGWSITIGLATIYAFAPLLILFEPDIPMPDGNHPEREALDDAAAQATKSTNNKAVRDTALLIPCYKSAKIIGPTLEAALKIFLPENIFVIANGNSTTPLDNTKEVVCAYGVHHIWSPVGSKIVAQFVGCYAAKAFRHVLLIDDDCALPPNFPVVADRIQGAVTCIGYTIKSVGPRGTKGNWCQQAQDLEYKISGLQRALAGKIGSVTFPHGAISLWDRAFLVRTFYDHPGFSVSEDWFFGHSCRRLGGRIKMCTAVFVETETPAAVFFSSGGSRGGFGEMTVFKQRFLRWNFFFVNGLWYNMVYVVSSWKLGFWELGAKLFVLQEVYETLLYLFTPFILPISLLVRPAFSGSLLGLTLIIYLLNVLILNEVHLRRKKERVGWAVLILYYMPYKVVLTFVNVASCYWSLFKYARFFAKRHPKVIEDEKAVGVVLHLEDEDIMEKSVADGGIGGMMGAVRKKVEPESSGMVLGKKHESNANTDRWSWSSSIV